MSALGKLLREKREALGLSLKDVSAKTRIREYVLEVLEGGRFMELPSYVHVHGFVKQYTESLGLDFADVKKMLDAECKKSEFGRDYREEAETRKRQEEAGEGDSNRSTMFIALGAILLIVVILVIRTITGAPKDTASTNAAEPTVQTEQATMPAPAPADNVTAAADNVTDNGTSIATPPRETDNATAAGNTTADVSTASQNPADAAAITPDADNDSAPLPVIQEPVNMVHTANLSFTDICWVHINIDGAEDIDFIAQAGETRQIEFVDYFIIDIGNAAAVAITDGNRTHAYFGEYAQPVRNLRFSYNQNDRFIYERL